MGRGRLKIIGIFIAAGILYFAWMTGFSFEFRETQVFPNYALLVKRNEFLHPVFWHASPKAVDSSPDTQTRPAVEPPSEARW